MSHEAVNWALQQRALKDGPWRVLVQLADRHNKDTRRCDPEQATIAYDCNKGRSSINENLNSLEKTGHIRRIQRIDPRTKKQLPTFYILGFDFDKDIHVDNAVSGIKTRVKLNPVSGIQAIPCPENRQSRVRNPDTNPVREPYIDDDDNARAETLTDREIVLIAMGHDKSGVTANGRMVGSQADVLTLKKWQNDLGLSIAEIDTIIFEVTKRRSGEPPPITFSYFNNPMQKFAGEKVAPKLKPIEGKSNEKSTGREQFDEAHREYARRIGAGEIDRGPDPSDPFAGR